MSRPGTRHISDTGGGAKDRPTSAVNAMKQPRPSASASPSLRDDTSCDRSGDENSDYNGEEVVSDSEEIGAKVVSPRRQDRSHERQQESGQEKAREGATRRRDFGQHRSGFVLSNFPSVVP